MKKRIKIGSTNVESDLPQPIIHHIQSFLTGKEAAQTTLLSKSWHGAWLTRPHLDLDQSCFQRPGFIEFANATLQRYVDSNLKIESFRLCMKNRDLNKNHTKWITKAIELGTTDVEFVDLSRDLNFGGVLPNEVFASEDLVRLSAEGCEIDLGRVKVKCAKLKYLSLCAVRFKGDIIWKIISSFPLIEELRLSNCKSHLERGAFDAFKKERLRVVASGPFNVYTEENVGGWASIDSFEFRKLKYLVLQKVRIDTSFFTDFSSKFPCLMELTLHECAGYYYTEVEISSRTLRYVSFVQVNPLRAKFDVPGICEFKLKSSFIPVVRFENTPDDWVSDISLSCKRPGTLWFVNLKKFLTKLSNCRIYLNVWFGSFLDKSYDYGRDIKSLPKTLIENLQVLVGGNMLVSSLEAAHLNALIWSCRPKSITQVWLPKPAFEVARRQLLTLFCKTLVREESEDCYVLNRNLPGLEDLEDVNLEIYDESVEGWVPLPWKTLLDASAFPETKRLINFQLEWNEASLSGIE